MIKKQLSLCVLFGILFSFYGCHTVSEKSSINLEGNHKVYRPQDYGELTPTNMSFNAHTGEVRYTLSQPALVRLRVGIENAGALLCHMLDWDFRDTGTHVEKWDKKDSTGLIDFGNRNDYSVVLNARPVNNKHDLKLSPHLNIFFPDATEKTQQGIPIVNGLVPLRVLLNEQDRQVMADSKFEVALYVDLVFLMEDEVGTNPFNYILDASNFSDGQHILTVNLIGYSGLMGTGTIKFFVRHS